MILINVDVADLQDRLLKLEHLNDQLDDVHLNDEYLRWSTSLSQLKPLTCERSGFKCYNVFRGGIPSVKPNPKQKILYVFTFEQADRDPHDYRRGPLKFGQSLRDYVNNDLECLPLCFVGDNLDNFMAPECLRSIIRCEIH